MASWDIEMTEAIGKAIPNEVSKLAGWLKFIPGIGQAAQVVGGIDAGTTAYADTYEKNKEAGVSSDRARLRAFWNAVNSSGNAAMVGQDPGMYGSGGHRNDDWANKIGSTAGLFNAFGGGRGGTGGNLQGIMGAGSNAYGYWTGDHMGYDPAMMAMPLEVFKPRPMNYYDPYINMEQEETFYA